MSAKAPSRPAKQIQADLLREVAAVLRAKGQEVAAEIVEREFGLARKCVHCGKDVPMTRNRQAKYCRDACRTAHTRKPWGPEKVEYQRQWRAKRRERQLVGRLVGGSE